MAPSSLAAFVMCLQVFISSSYALKCHEGFNMSFNGIPLYYWTERECTGNSECMGQEFAVDVLLADKPLRTSMRYGACVSTAYANYLDCQNLFGSGSTFDPANLLDMIPGIVDAVNLTVIEFGTNVSTSLKELLSDGTGMTAFVDGLFAFNENLGFNFKKAEPLKPSIVRILTDAIEEKRPDASLAEFFNAFAQLDTKNDEFSSVIRSLLASLKATGSLDPVWTTLIDRAPGLVRSIFPSNWQVELWYDVAFKLAGNINPADWTKSTEDMVSTIKASYQIPEDVGRYVNPVLDALPDLAGGLQVNPAYVGNWSLELLKTFSEGDAATKTLAMALERFLGQLTDATLQYEFKATIQWIPGLFYKFFPGDKATIQDVYRKMADGLNSFDFNDLASTADETALSRMIKNMITTLGGQQSFAANPFYNTLVVNFAKMFYDLMKVTPTDYTPYIDSFSKVIDDEFKKWPVINVGGMVTELIKQMGGTVPDELRPTLTSIQPLFSVLISTVNGTALNGADAINACYEVISSYKAIYPDSPFPDLVKRFIDIVYEMTTIDRRGQPVTITYPDGYTSTYYSNSKARTKYRRLQFELIYWNIDMEFAVVNSCRFGSCGDDLCNTQQYISLKQEFTKAATPAPLTTTSDARQLTAGLIFHTAVIGMTCKLVL